MTEAVTKNNDEITARAMWKYVVELVPAVKDMTQAVAYILAWLG